MSVVNRALTFTIVSCAVWFSVNGDDLCSMCNCRENEKDSMTIDCVEVDLKHVTIEWPKDFVNDTICKDKTLTIRFTSNNVAKLERFPPLNCKAISLYIENNPLKDVAYAAFRDLKNLNYLKMEHDQLTSEIVRGDIFRGEYNDRLYEPLDLRVLHLDHNELHSLGMKLFVHTPNLKHLHISNNPLEMLDVTTTAALSSLSKLETLDLSYTGISTMPDEIMKNMKQLRHLRLAGNKFKRIPESLGFVGATLRKLIFNLNCVEELNDNSFLGLWRLEHLEVGGMETLTKVKSDAFGQLVSLKMLHLCHNKNLKEIDHHAFDNLLNNNWTIQELYIHDNGLTEVSVDLVPWGQLISVNLEENPWNCDCKLAMTLENNGLGRVIPPTSTPRCLTPLEMAGSPLSGLSVKNLCTKSQRMNDTMTVVVAPQFMKGIMNKPGNAVFGFVFVCVVVVFGMSVGFCVTYVKTKFKRSGFERPIQYRTLANH